MENRRPMLVEDAFRVTGRTRGVAETTGIALIPLDPAVIAVLRREPLYETILPFDGIEADIMRDRPPARLHPVDDRLENAVVKEDAVFRMVGDIFQLVVEQPRVDRVQHPAHPAGTVPGGEMPRVVHGESRDSVAG